MLPQEFLSPLNGVFVVEEAVLSQQKVVHLLEHVSYAFCHQPIQQRLAFQ